MPSLSQFLQDHRVELIERARRRVSARKPLRADSTELQAGIPLFLSHLDALFSEASRGDAEDASALEQAAGVHGAALLKNGLSVAQAIHDYGDICQAVTELAMELRVPISPTDYNVFNRCLDSAMAMAVTEYLRAREEALSLAETEHFGALAHEQRNLLSAAMLAFQVLRGGSVGMTGATAGVLERSLLGLRDLTDRSLAAVRVRTGLHHVTQVEMASFTEEIEAAAAMEARVKGLHFSVTMPPYGAIVDADHQLLGSAVMNLVGNAFKFTPRDGTVALRTNVLAGKVTIEVQDECGGLPARTTDMFKPFDQRSSDRTGLGLGLSIARKAVTACGGSIRVTNLPGEGCIFVIELQLAAPPAPAA